MRRQGENPLQLDSRAPKIPLEKYMYMENRFKMLTKSKPEDAKRLLQEAQDDVERALEALRIPGSTHEVRQCRRSDGTRCTKLHGGATMDLTTTYLGLTLRTPLVPSASPLSEEIDNIKRMEDAGAAAVVLYSLFEEQLRQDRYELHHHLTAGTDSFAEALTYFPEPTEFHLGPEGYLEHIRKAKEAVDIPIIASLNGTSLGGWTDYAAADQAGRRRRAGAEHLLHPHRHGADRRRRSSRPTSTSCRR